MKILYLITALGLGGAEKVLLDLADLMVDNGHKVKIVYMADILELSSRNSIEKKCLNIDSIFSIPRALFEFNKIVKDFQPDIIHSHMVHANIFGRIFKIINSKYKLINTAHSSNEGGWLRVVFYRLTHNFSNLNTNVSTDAVKAFENQGAVPRNSMKVVFNGIDLNKYSYKEDSRTLVFNELGIPLNYKLITSIGRLTEAKDFPNLILGVYKYKMTNPLPFKVVIAGKGELQNELMALIKEYNLQDDILLLGRRNDINNILSATDLFILSSKYEGLPTVLLEAISCNCLPISTQCNGVSDILIEPRLTFSVGDSDALSQKIYEVFSWSAEDINKIKDQLYLNLVENFSFNSYYNNWIKTYKEVLSENI